MARHLEVFEEHDGDEVADMQRVGGGVDTHVGRSILNETMSVSGQLLVKLFCREQYEYDRYEAANRKMVDLNIRESMAGRWFRVVISTFSNIGPMLLYLVGGILIMRYNSSLTVGDITVLVALLGKMYMPVNSLLNIQVDWMRAMALFSRIFEYFDMPIGRRYRH